MRPDSAGAAEYGPLRRPRPRCALDTAADCRRALHVGRRQQPPADSEADSSRWALRAALDPPPEARGPPPGGGVLIARAALSQSAIHPPRPQCSRLPPSPPSSPKIPRTPEAHTRRAGLPPPPRRPPLDPPRHRRSAPPLPPKFAPQGGRSWGGGSSEKRDPLFPFGPALRMQSALPASAAQARAAARTSPRSPAGSTLEVSPPFPPLSGGAHPPLRLRPPGGGRPDPGSPTVITCHRLRRLDGRPLRTRSVLPVKGSLRRFAPIDGSAPLWSVQPFHGGSDGNRLALSVCPPLRLRPPRGAGAAGAASSPGLA